MSWTDGWALPPTTTNDDGETTLTEDANLAYVIAAAEDEIAEAEAEAQAAADELKAAQKAGKADRSTITKLEARIKRAAAKAKRAKEKRAKAQARKATAKAAAGAEPGLSPIGMTIAGAAAGAVLASFLGRTATEGAVVGAIGAGGYAYIRSRSEG